MQEILNITGVSIYHNSSATLVAAPYLMHKYIKCCDLHIESCEVIVKFEIMQGCLVSMQLWYAIRGVFWIFRSSFHLRFPLYRTPEMYLGPAPNNNPLFVAFQGRYVIPVVQTGMSSRASRTRLLAADSWYATNRSGTNMSPTVSNSWAGRQERTSLQMFWTLAQDRSCLVDQTHQLFTGLTHAPYHSEFKNQIFNKSH